MSDRAQTRGAADRAAIAPPRCAHGLVALAGVALLIGSTLGLLWPRSDQRFRRCWPSPMTFADSDRARA